MQPLLASRVRACASVRPPPRAADRPARVRAVPAHEEDSSTSNTAGPPTRQQGDTPAPAPALSPAPAPDLVVAGSGGGAAAAPTSNTSSSSSSIISSSNGGSSSSSSMNGGSSSNGNGISDSICSSSSSSGPVAVGSSGSSNSSSSNGNGSSSGGAVTNGTPGLDPGAREGAATPPSRGSGATGAAGGGADAEVDAALEGLWQQLKGQLARELPPDQAELLGSMTAQDAMRPEAVMRAVAEAQLGPVLQSLGVQEDPFPFLLEVVRGAAVVQLATGVALFAEARLAWGLDSSSAAACVGALALGYFLRIGVPVEQLLAPLYSGLLTLLSAPAVYEVPPATADERAATLQRLGLVVACSLLLPQLVWGWSPATAAQQVLLPIGGGLALFDVTYLVALLWRLRRYER